MLSLAEPLKKWSGTYLKGCEYVWKTVTEWCIGWEKRNSVQTFLTTFRKSGRKSDPLVSFCYTYIIWCIYEQVLSYYKNKTEHYDF